MTLIEKHWYTPHWSRFCLAPFALLYGFFARLKFWSYQCKLLASHKVDAPVIVVGNLSVGGTGKSPIVAALAIWLREQGYKPGLVSRGYAGQASTWPQTVTANSDPRLVGDEPVMLVQQTGCPMVVGPDRVAAARQLLAKTDCNIVISDDGLQHYRLARDVEIVVFDAKRGFGNEWVLPAGPLREGMWRLRSVDAVIANGKDVTLAAEPIVSVQDPKVTLSLTKDQPIHAVAGIGHPERFFDTMSALGLNIIPHAFPDHHAFSARDIDFPGFVIMTAKDAVKCRRLADQRHYYLPVKAVLPDHLKFVVQNAL